MVRLRKYTPADFRYINGLTKRNMSPYFPKYKVVWEARKHRESLKKGDIRVVELNKRRAGFLHISHNDDYSYIHNVQLSPLHRRKGFGSLLMNKAHELAAKAGNNKVRATVYPENTASMKMLEKLGYKVIRKEADGKLIVEKTLD